jgi:hypothetical protein
MGKEHQQQHVSPLEFSDSNKIFSNEMRGKETMQMPKLMNIDQVLYVHFKTRNVHYRISASCLPALNQHP